MMTGALSHSRIDPQHRDYLLDPALRDASVSAESGDVTRLLSRFIATRMMRAAFHDGKNVITTWLHDQQGDLDALAELLAALPQAIEDPRVLMEIAYLRGLANGLIPASDWAFGTAESKQQAAQVALENLVVAWARGLMPGTKIQFRPDRGAGRPRKKPADVEDLRCAGRFKEVAQALHYRSCVLERTQSDPFVLRPNRDEPLESFIARVARDVVHWAWENTSLSWMPRFRQRRLKSVYAKAIVRQSLAGRRPRISLIAIAYALLAAHARTSSKAVQRALERAERGVETRHPTKVSTPRCWRRSLQGHA